MIRALGTWGPGGDRPVLWEVSRGEAELTYLSMLRRSYAQAVAGTSVTLADIHGHEHQLELKLSREECLAIERGEASTVRRLVGSGLGLSIVKHLVESMGGTVSVSSRIGMGTTFVVSLSRMASR